MFFLEIQKCMIFFFSHLVSVFYLFSTSLALIGERGGEVGMGPSSWIPSPTTVRCMLQKELSISMDL